MPWRSVRPGGQVVDDALKLGAVGRELATSIAHRDRQSADFGLAHRLLPCGLAGRLARGQVVEGAVGELAAGEVAVGVVAAQQQRLEPVGLPGAAGGQLFSGGQQYPQGLPVTVSAWSG